MRISVCCSNALWNRGEDEKKTIRKQQVQPNEQTKRVRSKAKSNATRNGFAATQNIELALERHLICCVRVADEMAELTSMIYPHMKNLTHVFTACCGFVYFLFLIFCITIWTTSAFNVRL